MRPEAEQGRAKTNQVERRRARPRSSPLVPARPVLAFLVLVSGATACTRDQWQRSPSPDDLIAAIPWFAVMKRSVAIHPYRMPRPPVSGTVPVTGVEPPLPITRDNLPAINRLVNPVQRTSESIERGRDRYEVYCRVCHGDEGHGDGPVVPKFFPPPNLTAQPARSYTDGYLYTIIRHGRGLMPAYGDRVRGEDRWHVVSYIRVLQGATAR